jgi:hypothetical protein
MIFQVVTAEGMNIIAFRDNVPCSIVEVDRRFRDVASTNRIILQWRYYPAIRLDRLRKPIKNLSQDRRLLDLLNRKQEC